MAQRSTEIFYFQGFLFFGPGTMQGRTSASIFTIWDQPMINFENLHLGRRERSALRELLRASGYWRIETSRDTFAIKEFLARP
jgi:hypothetical protein